MLEAAPLQGLTTDEAQKRLSQYGPNSVEEAHSHPWLTFLRKFWAPVPWMLEVTILLQLALGKTTEALIIGILLLFNAILSFAQESRANRALALLKKQLSVQARVLRDQAWRQIPASDVVPGDILHLRMGDLSPADMHVLEGQVLADESALTGESLPIEAKAGSTIHAGVIIKRGEATGEVTATGARTYFGKTAELVRTAKTASHLEYLIFTIVKYLVAVDVLLVIALLLYSWATGIPLTDVIPFALILLVASVPIALPATYTLATALGALELAKQGVLVTRLSAIEEAAAMDILASDKTGTITQNQLALNTWHVYEPYTEDQLLRLAAMACDEATQDPIDIAILNRARGRNLLTSLPPRTGFIPFDPDTKRSEAIFNQDGHAQHVIKGAPSIVAGLVETTKDIHPEVEQLGMDGSRVLAVATGLEGKLELAGLIALQDPPREDSRQLIQNLNGLGVRVMMLTGDGPATARAIGAQVGMGDRVCPPEDLHKEIDGKILNYDLFARVLPEDKFHLVRTLQDTGHVVGMSGDGVNDAPALKQAEVGIAVANATDVAKAAASLVLTNPGLGDIQSAVETSRRIYQRMLTYILNKIIKTMEIAVFLSVGVMVTGVFVITPLLIILLLFTNDFVTMSLATDRVAYSNKPDRWQVPALMTTAGALAGLVLILSFTVFYAGRDWLQLPLPQLQTLIFAMLVFTGQGNVYLVRERRHFWKSRPSNWLILASVLDILLVGLLASQGILMAPIPLTLIAGLLAVVVGYLFLVDFLKIVIFRKFDL